MIGDALGDHKAAKGNHALFFPVNPGHQDESWEFFFAEAVEKFRDGRFTSEYEAKLFANFERLLPVVPPWKK